MEMKKYRKPNTTDKLKNVLVDFMVLHPELLSGKNTSKSTVKHTQKLWENIPEVLNSEVGPKKSWSEWRKTWCDLKTNVKGKAGSNRKERNKTGGGEIDLEVFNELENKILELLGPTIVEGHSSVEESVAYISFFVPHLSTLSLNKSNTELVDDMPAMIDQDVSDDHIMWNDGCLTGLEDQINLEGTNKVVGDNCANDDSITNCPTVSQPSIRNVHNGKKKQESIACKIQLLPQNHLPP